MRKKKHKRKNIGVLLLDEIKLMESVYFDRKRLMINSLTNLRDYTPEHKINKKGDHALVLMYHFVGYNVFLSKGCASSTVLHKIITEAVMLLENLTFM